MNGKNLSESITFNKVIYTVTFTESNLPRGSTWILTFNNVQYTLTNTSYTFHVINESFTYTIGSISGYKTSNSTDTMSVNGKNVTENITFSKLTSNTDLYIIIGAASAAVIVAVVAIVIWRRK